jgi:hypothetical protein
VEQAALAGHGRPVFRPDGRDDAEAAVVAAHGCHLALAHAFHAQAQKRAAGCFQVGRVGFQEQGQFPAEFPGQYFVTPGRAPAGRALAENLAQELGQGQ